MLTTKSVHLGVIKKCIKLKYITEFSVYFRCFISSGYGRIIVRPNIVEIRPSTVFGYYPIALIRVAILSDNKTEPIFQGVMAIVTVVLVVKLYYFVLHMGKIIFFIRMCQYHKRLRKVQLSELENSYFYKLCIIFSVDDIVCCYHNDHNSFANFFEEKTLTATFGKLTIFIIGMRI